MIMKINVFIIITLYQSLVWCMKEKKGNKQLRVKMNYSVNLL